MRPLLILFAMASCAFANELKPYDKFSKDNVRLEHKERTHSTFTDTWRTDYGSRGDDKTVTKQLIIEAKQTKAEKLPITIEAFFVRKNNSGRYIVPAGEAYLDTGVGEATFSETGRSSKYKFVALGYSVNNVDKVYGWFARAVTDDGRVVGAIASAEQYRITAENPRLLEGQLGKLER